jgi:hypothetical protein
MSLLKAISREEPKKRTEGAITMMTGCILSKKPSYYEGRPIGYNFGIRLIGIPDENKLSNEEGEYLVFPLYEKVEKKTLPIKDEHHVLRFTGQIYVDVPLSMLAEKLKIDDCIILYGVYCLKNVNKKKKKLLEEDLKTQPIKQFPVGDDEKVSINKRKNDPLNPIPALKKEKSESSTNREQVVSIGGNVPSASPLSLLDQDNEKIRKQPDFYYNINADQVELCKQREIDPSIRANRPTHLIIPITDEASKRTDFYIQEYLREIDPKSGRDVLAMLRNKSKNSFMEYLPSANTTIQLGEIQDPLDAKKKIKCPDFAGLKNYCLFGNQIDQMDAPVGSVTKIGTYTPKDFKNKDTKSQIVKSDEVMLCIRFECFYKSRDKGIEFHTMIGRLAFYGQRFKELFQIENVKDMFAVCRLGIPSMVFVAELKQGTSAIEKSETQLNKEECKESMQHYFSEIKTTIIGREYEVDLNVRNVYPLVEQDLIETGLIFEYTALTHLIAFMVDLELIKSTGSTTPPSSNTKLAINNLAKDKDYQLDPTFKPQVSVFESKNPWNLVQGRSITNLKEYSVLLGIAPCLDSHGRIKLGYVGSYSDNILTSLKVSVWENKSIGDIMRDNFDYSTRNVRDRNKKITKEQVLYQNMFLVYSFIFSAINAALSTIEEQDELSAKYTTYLNAFINDIEVKCGLKGKYTALGQSKMPQWIKVQNNFIVIPFSVNAPMQTVEVVKKPLSLLEETQIDTQFYNGNQTHNVHGSQDSGNDDDNDESTQLPEKYQSRSGLNEERIPENNIF